VSVATNSPFLTNGFAVTYNVLTNGTSNRIVVANLKWPASHIGWRLQQQVNPVTVGISTNWTTVANSTSTNAMQLTNAFNNNCYFYRLVFP
jgi:hypothetical protein